MRRMTDILTSIQWIIPPRLVLSLYSICEREARLENVVLYLLLHGSSLS